MEREALWLQVARKQTSLVGSTSPQRLFRRATGPHRSSRRTCHASRNR